MKTIPLTQGKVALVDDVDWAALSAVKWSAHIDKSRKTQTFYAVRSVRWPGGGMRRIERMHRLILARKLGRPIAPGMECDHEDGDGLNNTRYNLRERTRRGNGENLHVDKSSQYIGVSWNQRDKRWKAQVQNGKIVYLGYFATELAAALARERYIEDHPDLEASSNFFSTGGNDV
jgi:hypothetical protein